MRGQRARERIAGPVAQLENVVADAYDDGTRDGWRAARSHIRKQLAELVGKSGGQLSYEVVTELVGALGDDE